MKHGTACQWVWAGAHSFLKGKQMSSMSKLNLSFAKVSCILPYSSKAEQRQHSPSEVPQKLWKWPFSPAGGRGRFLLLSDSFATLVQGSVVVLCENNGWVSPEISQEVFLVEEKCALSLCSDRKNSTVLMANLHCLSAVSQVFQNNETELKILLSLYWWDTCTFRLDS